MNETSVKIKENLTFYRKMANTNLAIMKKFNSAIINKMKYNDILEIYKNNNLDFKEDIDRLKLFLTQNKKNTHDITDNSSETMSEPIEINTETSECSEPNEDITVKCQNQERFFSKSVIEKNDLEFYNFNNIMSNKNYLIPLIIPVLISFVMYARRSQK
jgi:hypothetical protein